MRTIGYHTAGEHHLRCSGEVDIGDIISIGVHKYTVICFENKGIFIDRPLQADASDGASISVVGSYKYADYFWQYKYPFLE